MKKVTLLIPCYNEEQSLPKLHQELCKLMDSQPAYKWDVLLINDGSTDNTLSLLQSIRQEDERIGYIDLSRNFGKENAMLAGFDNAKGDCIVIMDADLQHPISVIPQMLEKWEEGFEDVYGKRITRGKESWLRKLATKIFYGALQKAARFDILPNVGDFRLLDRKCVEELKKIRETERYTKGMFAWIGFRKTFVEFETQDRTLGESHMKYSSLLELAFQGITSFTVAPLKWSIFLGILISLASFGFMIYILITTLIFGDPVAGYPTLITVILFLGGVQLLSLGIIGEYLGKIFNETKHRPVYIIRDKQTSEEQ